jgi:hypothetical protein
MTNTPTLLSPILDALNFEALAPDEQEELLVDLDSLILKGSMVRMMEKMDEHTREEFDALLESDPSEEEVDSFISEKVPQADQALAETIEDLKNDILVITQ